MQSKDHIKMLVEENSEALSAWMGEALKDIKTRAKKRTTRITRHHSRNFSLSV
jgi:hypothetical protein